MKVNVDAVAAAIHNRNLTKAANTLIGICSGIIADGQINDQEIFYLRTWLSENEEICSRWPGSVIAARIEAVLADRVVTEDERGELIECLKDVTGNRFVETGAAAPEGPVTIPFDDEPDIIFRHMTFCFTGQFYFGTRAACERAILQRDAMPVDRVTGKLDYLVVGTMVNPDWANETYGKKIEMAIERQERYGLPAIVSEKQWVDALVRHIPRA